MDYPESISKNLSREDAVPVMFRHSLKTAFSSLFAILVGLCVGAAASGLLIYVLWRPGSILWILKG